MLKNEIMRGIIDWLVQHLGYFTVVKLKDFILLLSGITLGALLSMVRGGFTYLKVQKVDQLGKATSVTFDHEGKEHYYTHIKTFFEAVEFLMIVNLVPFKNKREYLLEDKKRTRRFIYKLLIFMLLLIALGLSFAMFPIMSADYLPQKWR